MGSPEIQAVMALLDLLLSEAKDLLVSASAEDLVRAQAEARTYEKLTRLLTRAPLPMSDK